MRSERIGGLLLAGCLAALLVACGVPGERPAEPDARVAGDQRPPAEWAQEGGRPIPLDTGQSRLSIRVYRAGRLAHLGHNHVLAVRDLRGRLRQLDDGAGLAELAFGVDGILVDDPLDRSRAGTDFEQQPDAGAIAGTRRNMLGEKVLDANNWPEVQISARLADLAAEDAVAEVFVRLRGVSRRYQARVGIEIRAAEIRVSGTLVLRQSDFGITPFAVLGGALQVQDEVHADFLVVGHKSGGAM